MSVRIAAVVGLAVAAVVAPATSALAAPATAPSVAHSTQTQFLHQKPGGGYKSSVTIIFKGKTFSVPDFGDSGTFQDNGNTLTFTVHKSALHDEGCTFKAKYHAQSTNYAGTYHCPGGTSDTFAVTTTGS